jgi:hypothetical protein
MTATINAPPAADVHSPLSLFAGDDWSIVVTFLDAAGTPIDLTGATVLWTLLDGAGETALAAGKFTVAIGGAPGQCTLTVPATSTTALAGGTYNDTWRLVIGGIASTPLYGSFIVHADPFAATAPAVAVNIVAGLRSRVRIAA